jgi:hypothetical protein
MHCVPRGLLCALLTVFLAVGAGILLFRARDRSSASAALASPEQEQIAEQLYRTRQRILAKQAIIEEFLADRLTLREAADRFQKVDAEISPEQRALWRSYCPGDTDEDRYCWMVLRFVRPAVQDDPARARAARRRFEAELPAYLRWLLPAGPGLPGPAR